MSRLALYLLGPPRLELDGAEVHVSRRRAMALLVYLAVTGHSHSRDSLATLLWPELDQSTARARLRRALAALREAIGDGWLDADRETVGLAPDAEVWLDIDRFHGLLAACEAHDHPSTEACRDCFPLLEEAAELYNDHFLAGFTLRDSAAFDEWQFFETEGLKDELTGALVRLATYHASQGDFDAAIGHTRRWLGLDPLHEPAHRHLMALYAQAGQRAAALRQYEECARVLEEELGLSPSAETTSLYERIRTGPAERGEPSAQPRHNLPVQTTPFVGREKELATIEARLSDPDCRLLTLVGPGGSGKTRLALEAAMGRVEEYEHGVYFVSLAPLRSVDGIVPTVAQALGFSFYEGGEPRQQLLGYLRQKNMLIVMDNFEHLLDGVDLVTAVLKTAPDVKILATSRARLNVGGEHRFRVGGMSVPESPSGAVADAGQYSAVELFLQGARRAQPSFELTAENLSGVVQVCRLVDGMPLGIRLASAWVEMLAPEEIAAEIGRSFDLLETDRRDVPQRQRSMRATLDHSWRLLTEREREVFRALSVFRGGFTQEAAQEVTHASLHTLLTLVNKSLLHRAPTGRYEMHELLRQYAEEKLGEEPAAGETARDLHCAYYTAALQQWGADLKGSRQKTALAEMDAEIENARAAWDWAAERGQVERLDRAMDGLCWFYSWRSRSLEGEAACLMAVSKLATIPSGGGPVLGQATRAEGAIVGLQAPCPEALVLTDPVLSSPGQCKDRAKAPSLFRDPESLGLGTRGGTGGLRVWAKILAWQSRFTSSVGYAVQLMQQSLALLEGPALADQDTRAEKAYALFLTSTHSQVPGGFFQEARQLEEQSVALYRALGDRWAMAMVLDCSGRLAHDSLGDYDKAQRLCEESLAIRRSLGDQMGIANSLRSLGTTARALGQLEKAERLFRECFAIRQEMDIQRYIANSFDELGITFTCLGKFAEACSSMEECMVIVDDLGHRDSWAWESLFLCEAKAHLGQYEQARDLGQAGHTFFQETGSNIGFSFFELGLLALAEEAYAEAHQLLLESVAIYREVEHREMKSWALGLLGYAVRGLGRPCQARQHLCEALRTVADTGGIMPSLMYALPAVALLLADRGEVERAVEVYALASRYPFVANSRWFEDVAGKHIAAVAATLPPEAVAAAQERGRVRDLDATVAELLAELEGWKDE
jgi:predicted ATPase/DNA-binding SARP family transcriptional activator